jgi:hypothetical protein
MRIRAIAAASRCAVSPVDTVRRVVQAYADQYFPEYRKELGRRLS